jgi:hypothetical protein
MVSWIEGRRYIRTAKILTECHQIRSNSSAAERQSKNRTSSLGKGTQGGLVVANDKYSAIPCSGMRTQVTEARIHCRGFKMGDVFFLGEIMSVYLYPVGNLDSREQLFRWVSRVAF